MKDIYYSKLFSTLSSATSTSQSCSLKIFETYRYHPMYYHHIWLHSAWFWAMCWWSYRGSPKTSATRLLVGSIVTTLVMFKYLGPTIYSWCRFLWNFVWIVSLGQFTNLLFFFLRIWCTTPPFPPIEICCYFHSFEISYKTTTHFDETWLIVFAGA